MKTTFEAEIMGQRVLATIRTHGYEVCLPEWSGRQTNAAEIDKLIQFLTDVKSALESVTVAYQPIPHDQAPNPVPAPDEPELDDAHFEALADSAAADAAAFFADDKEGSE